MRKQKGSAYLVALGILSVLCIVVFLYSKTTTSRRWSTKLMTSEQRAQAVAEAAIDIALLIVRDQMNPDPADPTPDWKEWGQILRTPSKLKNMGASMGNGDGEDLPIDLNNAVFWAQPKTVKTQGGETGDLGPLQTLINSVPGSMTVDLEWGISSASAFAAKARGYRPAYHVVGINKPSLKANPGPGEFLDTLSPAGATSQSIRDQLVSDYILNLRLPNYSQQTETISLDINFTIKSPLPSPFDLSVTITIPIPLTLEVVSGSTPASQHPPYNPSDDLKIRVTIFGFEVFSMEVNLYDKYLQKFFEKNAQPTPDPGPYKKFKAQDFAKTITEAPEEWMNFTWSYGKFLTFIKNEFNNLPPLVKTNIPDEAFHPEMVVEKTGMVRFTARVHYEPHLGGGIIHRVLTAEREFKVSDLQPVAPEYVFFIANSKWPYESTLYSYAAEDDEILLNSPHPNNNNTPSYNSTLATSSIHSIPRSESDTKLNFNHLRDAFGAGSVSDQMHLPGMIRINGTNAENKSDVFTGTLEELSSTMYNLFMMNRKGNPDTVYNFVDAKINLMNVPSTPQAWNLPYVPIPTIQYPSSGLIELFDVLKTQAKLECPTMIFGDWAMEYPLSLRLESNLKAQYSKITAKIDPAINGNEVMKGIKLDWGSFTSPKIPPKITFDESKVDLTKIDDSEILMDHKTDTFNYGVYDYPAEPSEGDAWNPSKEKSLPANLYSPLQYAKKSTYYYPDNAAFKADLGNHTENGVFKCDGIFFVQGSLTLDQNFPDQVKGRGLLIANQNILLEKDVIKRADSNTVFGLIARAGRLQISGGKRLEAAVYSNQTPRNSIANEKFVIDGNLVINHFNRGDFNCIEVYYNGPGCRNTLLSMIRPVGKYEPLRYYVTLGKQWARFEYEKL